MTHFFPARKICSHCEAAQCLHGDGFWQLEVLQLVTRLSPLSLTFGANKPKEDTQVKKKLPG